MRKILLFFVFLLITLALVVGILGSLNLKTPRGLEKGAEPQESPAQKSPARSKAEIEEAYRYLAQLPSRWAGTSDRDCKTYTEYHIRQLNPDFAIRLSRMAKAWRNETGTPLTVLSAYRSAEEQKCACEGERGLCAGWKRVLRTEGTGLQTRTVTEYVPTGEVSNHTRGLAIDMRPGKGTMMDFVRLRIFLERHKEDFQLHMPYWSTGDRPHIEPIEIAPKTRARNRVRTKRHDKL